MRFSETQKNLHHMKSAPSSSKTEITLPFFMFVYWLWALVNFSSISENESMFRIGSVEAGKLPFLFDLLSSFTPYLGKKINVTKGQLNSE